MNTPLTVEELDELVPPTDPENVADMDTSNPTTEQVLEQRGNRYGSFEGNAILSQTLKNTIMQHYFTHHQPNPTPLDPVVAEAITMICHKLARIGNGDPTYIENWRDISGYSELVVSHLNNSENSVDARVTYVKKVGDEWVDMPK